MLENNVIAQLATVPNWVVWRYEKRDGGYAKPPYQIHENKIKRANIKDPTTWNDYESLKDIYKDYGMNGLGFCLDDSFNVVALDIDDCLDNNGSLNDIAHKVVDLLKIYWEISPSGKGLRGLFLWNSCPISSRKLSKLKVELYSKERYVTITGNMTDFSTDHLVAPSNRTLNQLCDLLGLKPAKKKSNPDKSTQQANFLSSANSCYTKMISSKHGGSYEALFAGEWEQLGYPSKSEARLALIQQLIYWSNQNEAMVRSLYRKSGLYDEKAERLEEDELGKAISSFVDYGGKQSKHRGGGWNRAQSLGNSPRVKGFVAPSVNGVELSKDDVDMLTNGFTTEDLGNAECFIAYSDKKFCYNKNIGWLYWTGTHWEREGAELTLRGAVADILRARQVAFIAKGIKGKDIPNKCTPNTSHIKNTIFILMSKLNSPRELFNSQDDKINCLNGVVSLRTGEIEPHKPEYGFTWVCQAKFNPQADMSAIHQHVRNTLVPENSHALLTGTTNYDRLLQYIQMALGYSISGETSDQCMFWLWGVRRAGKGTLMQTISTLFGKPMVANIHIKNLVGSRQSGNQNFDLARLYNARIVLASEPNDRDYLNADMIKVMTGDDGMTAAFKRQDNFEFLPKFKVWVQSNYPPNTQGNDDALWGRIKLIYAPNSYYGRENTQLKKQLLENLEGVLLWLVQGAIAWYRLHDMGKKLPSPQLVELWGKTAREDNDSVALWAKESLTPGDELKLMVSDAREHYNQWCNDMGYKPKYGRQFNKSMQSLGYGKPMSVRNRDRKVSKGWKGVGFLSNM